jgi:hypothetical protein
VFKIKALCLELTLPIRQQNRTVRCYNKQERTQTMDCSKCGYLNDNFSLACEKCSESLLVTGGGQMGFVGLAPVESDGDVPVGYSIGAVPESKIKNEMAVRGRRFMLAAVLLQALLILAPFAFLYFYSAEKRSDLLEMFPGLPLGYGFFAVLTVAYLVAKTGQAVGTPFTLNFVMSLIPPSDPGNICAYGGEEPHQTLCLAGSCHRDLFYCLPIRWISAGNQAWADLHFHHVCDVWTLRLCPAENSGLPWPEYDCLNDLGVYRPTRHVVDHLS